MAGKSYQADSIEVLEGLDPVRKRPGMYTDTTRPNHLAQEVIDNSVDEALEGHATEIESLSAKMDPCPWEITAGACRLISTRKKRCQVLN